MGGMTVQVAAATMTARRVTMRHPNFFIIGAPKCGTTSLYEHLGRHPRVCMASNKEPYFFCSDLPGYRERSSRVTTERDYLALFSHATDRQTHLGEASVYYLFSEVAVDGILDRYPEAKFIVLLRNPVEMVPSFHAELLLNGEEVEHCFERAWDLQGPRRHDPRRVPSGCRDAKVLQYRDVALFGEQVRRLLATVPRNQVEIMLLEDLRCRPRDMYRRILAFLGLEDDGRSEFPRANGHQAVRSWFLHHLMARPPFPLDVVKAALIRVAGHENRTLRSLRDLNTRNARRPPLSAAMRSTLVDAFAADIRLLGGLLGRNLEHWIQEPICP